MDKHLKFEQYLERKLKREPYPLKNMVFDIISRYRNEFKAELISEEKEDYE